MQPDRAKLFDTDTASELACPVCYGDLRSDGSHLVCTVCARAYPIVDGIPALIPERAEPHRESGL